MNQKPFQSSLWALIGLVALISCQTPLNTPKASSVTLSFSTAGRTVVADVASQVTSYAVTLTSHDGYASLNSTVTSGETATFAVVTAGTWDASVTAYHNAAAIGVGSLSNQTVSAGSALAWSVPVSTSQAGTGNFSFTFAVPATLGVSSVTGQLYTPANVATGAPFTAGLSTGSNKVGTMARAGVASGAYRLQLTFVRGTTTVGVYSEAINVWDGVTSDQWLDAAGALNSQRTFTVADFRATTWQTVGESEAAADTDRDGQSLALDSSDTPYVAYRDTAGSVRVMMYSADAWVSLGTPGKSKGKPSLAIDSTGIPYVAYPSVGVSGDMDAHSVLSVVKFENQAWVPVGEPEFADPDSAEPSLAFDPSGTPYVAYSDGLEPGYNDEKISVMKLQNGSWVQVGTPGFSPARAYSPSLAFDSSGAPYVAFLDTSADYTYSASVMKFDGKIWANVGNARFTQDDGNGFDPRLVIDASDTLYVTYCDSVNGYKASVMKFDGETWGYLGSPGFSNHDAYDTVLALDASGTPYVAFSEWDSDWTQAQTRVMKFEGNSWVAMGDIGVAGSDSTYPWLVIAASGAPYVAYTETGKVTVMKFE